MGLRMGWKPRTVTLGATLAGFALIALNGAAAAAFDPYTSRTLGYDYSYVQCGKPAPTTSFGVVGVNAGYPFTYYNNCLATEFAAAAGTGNAARGVAMAARAGGLGGRGVRARRTRTSGARRRGPGRGRRRRPSTSLSRAAAAAHPGE